MGHQRISTTILMTITTQTSQINASNQNNHVVGTLLLVQERLASRATGYTPKSLNTAVAQLVSHFQPEGPNVTSYLVPLPVVDVALGPRVSKGAEVVMLLSARNTPHVGVA
eukprot:1157764-Pelagomonas_calceolata.AAC.3